MQIVYLWLRDATSIIYNAQIDNITPSFQTHFHSGCACVMIDVAQGLLKDAENGRGYVFRELEVVPNVFEIAIDSCPRLPTLCFPVHGIRKAKIIQHTRSQSIGGLLSRFDNRRGPVRHRVDQFQQLLPGRVRQWIGQLVAGYSEIHVDARQHLAQIIVNFTSEIGSFFLTC